jgi:hypothetical protein
MWSSSFAGSICARRSAIGLGVGLGVAVGRDVAVAAIGLGVGDAAAGDEALDEPPGPASHATTRMRRSAAKALIVLG